MMWDEFLSTSLPSQKDERFKYADLTFLRGLNLSPIAKNTKMGKSIHENHLSSITLVFINGYFHPECSQLSGVPEGMHICDKNEANQQHADLLQLFSQENQDPFANLNQSQINDGVFIHLDDDCIVATPVHLLFIAAADQAYITHPQHYILLGKRSKVTVFEEYDSFSSLPYMHNGVINIITQDEAVLTSYKLQNESSQAVHIANTHVEQHANSQTSFTNISIGGRFARDNLNIKLQSSGATCKTSGFYHLQQDNQYIDHHVDVEHRAPYSFSEMLYKGIVDKKSRAVFNGRVLVTEGAQKIQAYQANHNLLLSSDAEVYAKPELEIYADDVKCKHGATIGQIDEEALFYLRSRGIERHEAMHILLEGFTLEIIQRIADPTLKQHVQAKLAGINYAG